MKKNLVILLSCLLVFSSSVITASASTDIVPPEYVYVHSSTSYSRSQDWSHESDNPTNIVQSTTYSVSRTANASFSTGISETVDAMIAKAGVSIEVSIGTSITVSASHTYNIPAHSKYKCIWGSQHVYEAGYQDYYWNNILQSHTYVSGSWTYGSYDDMVYLGYY